MAPNAAPLRQGWSCPSRRGPARRPVCIADQRSRPRVRPESLRAQRPPGTTGAPDPQLPPPLPGRPSRLRRLCRGRPRAVQAPLTSCLWPDCKARTYHRRSCTSSRGILRGPIHGIDPLDDADECRLFHRRRLGLGDSARRQGRRNSRCRGQHRLYGHGLDQPDRAQHSDGGHRDAGHHRRNVHGQRRHGRRRQRRDDHGRLEHQLRSRRGIEQHRHDRDRRRQCGLCDIPDDLQEHHAQRQGSGDPGRTRPTTRIRSSAGPRRRR